MNSYGLILKVMRAVDRRDPHRPGLTLKDLITIGDIHIGIFDPDDRVERNIMGFTQTGERLWSIDSQPGTHERFSRAWQRITVGDDGDLVAIGSDGARHQIDHRTGNIRQRNP